MSKMKFQIKNKIQKTKGTVKKKDKNELFTQILNVHAFLSCFTLWSFGFQLFPFVTNHKKLNINLVTK